MPPAMQGTGDRGETMAPAPSYAAHRDRALAASFPIAMGVLAVAVLLYALVDLPQAPTAGQFATYGIELVIPLLGWLLSRRLLRGNIEAAAIMGVSVEALESLLGRGRRALRAALADLKE